MTPLWPLYSLIARAWRRLFPKPDEIRPNRAARRALARMKPGEQRQHYLEGALRKAKRKAARGFRPAHVRKRQVAAAAYAHGYRQGGADALSELNARLRRQVKRNTKSKSLIDNVWAKRHPVEA